MSMRDPFVGVVTTSAPVHRDRSVPSRTVPCPTCAAAEGVDCVTSNGAKATPHDSRRRMAIRLLNRTTEAYSTEDLRIAQITPPVRRRALRRRRGLSTRALGALIGVPGPRITKWEAGGQMTGPNGAAYGAWLRSELTK